MNHFRLEYLCSKPLACNQKQNSVDKNITKSQENSLNLNHSIKKAKETKHKKLSSALRSNLQRRKNAQQ